MPNFDLDKFAGMVSAQEEANEEALAEAESLCDPDKVREEKAIQDTWHLVRQFMVACCS